MVCKSEPLLTTRRTKCTPLQRRYLECFMWRALETCVFNENFTIWSISLPDSMSGRKATRQHLQNFGCWNYLGKNSENLKKKNTVLYIPQQKQDSLSRIPCHYHLYVYIVYISYKSPECGKHWHCLWMNKMGSHTTSPPLYLQNFHLVNRHTFGTRTLESQMQHMCSEMMPNDSPT